MFHFSGLLFISCIFISAEFYVHEHTFKRQQVLKLGQTFLTDGQIKFLNIKAGQ